VTRRRGGGSGGREKWEISEEENVTVSHRNTWNLNNYRCDLVSLLQVSFTSNNQEIHLFPLLLEHMLQEERH